MIRVNRPPRTILTDTLRASLTAQHVAAGMFSRNDPQIDRAWRNFRRTVSGRSLLQALSTAFRSKCVFCERVNAKTVDHFYPKERYPRRMFRWTNLLMCCADCNNAKGTKFPFDDRRPRFINPTREDPASFFAWDLMTGGMFGVSDPGAGDRADFTRDELRLNDQPLLDERRAKLGVVQYLLSRIVREPAVEVDTRERLEAELRVRRPYLGILRFWLANLSPDYRLLVDAARAKLPEIDAWISLW